jgi:3-dehydroquinate synthase
VKPKPAARVSTGGGSYPIYVGAGLIEDAGRLLAEHGARGRAVAISDEGVAPAHAQTLSESLELAGFSAEVIMIGEGEPAKSLATVEKLYDRLAELAVERGDTIVSLGGGLVGDVAGFVAATYLRGVSLAHVPTSLLAMADAAIGGKTGVNHPRGKNLIGAFYQPILVIEDPSLLATMPDRAYREGFAELIKHGLIADVKLLDQLESRGDALLARDEGVLTEVLVASARAKAAIVSADEREADKRMWLNYGHTVGHAIEAATNYEAFLHGEAVTVGLMAAATIGLELGMLSEADARRHRDVIERYGLPVATEGLPAARVREAMQLDKKRAGGQQRWVLLEGLANPVVRSDVPDEVLVEALAAVGIG